MGPWVEVQMNWNGITMEVIVDGLSSPTAVFPGKSVCVFVCVCVCVRVCVCVCVCARACYKKTGIDLL